VDTKRLRSLLGHDCHLTTLGSTATTNDEALVVAAALARSGGLYEALPLVVVSERQTAGRGRLGRVWTSPPGGVYLSVLAEVALPAEAAEAALFAEAVQPTEAAEAIQSAEAVEAVEAARSAEVALFAQPTESAEVVGAARSVEAKRREGAEAPSSSALSVASLSPLTALAAHDALQGFSSQRLSIKWPNDLVLERGKLAGILVEAKRGGAVFPNAPKVSPKSLFAVIGVGINVNRPTEGAFVDAAYLQEGAGRGLELEEVAAAVIDGILAYHASWLDAGCSFAPFAVEYRRRMALLGVPVCVRSATGMVIASGSVKGVDKQGRLLVAQAQGVVAVAAGEVTLRDS
jgi:BirA family biotin operon repressor/biotin-[acetyl-CoA-carboxylase] ligase